MNDSASNYISRPSSFFLPLRDKGPLIPAASSLFFDSQSSAVSFSASQPKADGDSLERNASLRDPDIVPS